MAIRRMRQLQFHLPLGEVLQSLCRFAEETFRAVFAGT